jgi:hypothetical protein
MTNVRRFITGALIALVAALVLSPPTAYADQVPFTDPNAKGYIGLCDKNNENITSGSVGAAPFVWKAVSSAPPPAQFQGKGENAILNIYQPRPGVDPGNWNGDSLTSASFYNNPKLPAAQATRADLPLSVIVNEFPPMVDGLYQLRMFYGKAGYGLYSSTYPAAVIRVSGDTWTLVQGGTVDCTAAPAVSNEVLAGTLTQAPSGNASGSKSSAGAPSGAPQSGPATASHASPGSPASRSGSTKASQPGSTAAAQAARHASSSSDAAPIGAGIAGAVALAGIAAGLWYWRRRRSAPQ